MVYSMVYSMLRCLRSSREKKRGVQLAKVQHEHSLILVDLQSVYQNYEEDDEDLEEFDFDAMQKFKCTCNVCGLRIDWYHRYYYKCDQPPCSYSFHKFCVDLSLTFQFPGHPIHTLYLIKRSVSWSCHGCLTEHQDGACYQCSTCDYEIDIRCATFAEQTKIYHPSHPHPLISSTLEPTLSKCYSCGKEHKGVFYHCVTCFSFSIHIDCVKLPFKFINKDYHSHMLTLSYSFSAIASRTKCRICGISIRGRIWKYKCSKCRYFVHVECATSRREPFMSILSRGIRETKTNSKLDDYPTSLLRYPLLNESFNILSDYVRREDYEHFDQTRFDNGIYIHPSHNHPLHLINTPDTNTLGTLHNPMTRIKLVCNGCLRPITSLPYYLCNQEVSDCNFHLHEWCTRLPSELKEPPCHRKHSLFLFHSLSNELAELGFECHFCKLRCNGFGYRCSVCHYQVDVHCGFIPKKILHEGHPNHILVSTRRFYRAFCDGCGASIPRHGLRFRCNACDFDLDIRCALNLPKTIKNKYDKHPLTLSYYPIENHKNEYFCEVCEEELIPEAWFYHCHECRQSIHPACGPLILRSEQGVNSVNNREGVYKFLNMKFGGLIRRPEHPHPLSLFAGTISDCCNVCKGELQSLLIFKCLDCILAFHVTCVVKDMEMKSFIADLGVKEKLSYFRFYRGPREEFEVEDQEEVHDEPVAAQTFYPSQVMRPIMEEPS